MRVARVALSALLWVSPAFTADVGEGLEEARRETKRRVVESAGDPRPTAEALAGDAISTKEWTERDPVTGSVILVGVQTYRGSRRIKVQTSRDSDRDGRFDVFWEAFYVGTTPVLTILRHEARFGRSLGMTGLTGVDVTLSDPDRDGDYEAIGIMDTNAAEPRLIEAYKRGADGFFCPASAEEYDQARRHLHAVAPIVEATVDAIRSAPGAREKEGTGAAAPPGQPAAEATPAR